MLSELNVFPNPSTCHFLREITVLRAHDQEQYAGRISQAPQEGRSVERNEHNGEF